MINTIWAVIRDGKIVPLEAVQVPEGTRALVTCCPKMTLASGWPQVSLR